MPKDTGLDEALTGSNGPAESLSFYNGTIQLYYNSALHAYYQIVDGKKLICPGVTTVIAMIDKSGPLTQWSANMAVQYLREKMTSVTDPDLAVNDFAITVGREKFEKLLNEARFNYRQISKDATDIGHMAHEWLDAHIQRWVNGLDSVEPVPIPADQKATNCVMAALDWMGKHKFRPIDSERKIFSRQYGYAGTYDWAGYITGCGDPTCCPFEGEVFAMGDFKSSKALYDEYRAQIAAYKKAYEEEFPHQPLGLCVILRLGKEDGDFEPMYILPEESDIDFDGFLGTLQMYNWAKQIDLDEKYAKAVARAEAKAEKEALKAELKAAKAALKETAKQAKPKKPVKRAEIKEYEGIPVEA